MTLLYILPEHPSASQTFVVKEAHAVSRHGVSVVGYALARGADVEPAAPVDLLAGPAGRSRLLACIALSPKRAIRTVWHCQRDGISLREAVRLLLALGHAVHVARAARAASVTHIHAHFLGRASDVADVLASILGCSWTATAHASDAYAPVEPMLLDRRLRTAASIACANDGVRQSLVARVGSRIALRAKIVHCGVETAELPFTAHGRCDGTKQLIVTVGRLVATKGHWTVVSAAEQLLAENPELTWIVVGDGPLRHALTSDPRVRRLRPRMSYAGSLSHAQILRLVGRASVFVMPCEQGARGESDGIPVALMEAMALGVPVITSPVGGIPELVSDGETGFLVPPQRAELLVVAIRKVLYQMSHEERDRIRQAARARVECDFDLVRESEKLICMLSPHLVAGASR